MEEEYKVIFEQRTLMNDDYEEIYCYETVGFLDIHNENELITELNEIIANAFVLDDDKYKIITDVPNNFIDNSEPSGNFDLVDTFSDYDQAVDFIKGLEKISFEKGKFWDDQEDED